MTDHLYVCRFANGLTKVGRDSRFPCRPKQHATLGAIHLNPVTEFHGWPVIGDARSAESVAISWASLRASRQFGNEWFYGLDLATALKAVEACCDPVTRGPVLRGVENLSSVRADQEGCPTCGHRPPVEAVFCDWRCERGI